MWQSEIKKNIPSTSNYFHRYTIIAFPIIYCTAFIDNIVSYICKIQFIPGVNYKYTDIITSLLIVITCTVVMVLMVKCNKNALNIIVCVMITGLCYMFGMETNAISIPLEKCIISYTIY